METHLRIELVLAALEMAIGQRKPRNVIHHSDQGTHYTSLTFGGRCREAGVRPSIGSVGDAYDSAMCESFFATLECELLGRHRFTSQAEARMAVFSYIEGWYNPARRHSGIRIYPRSPTRCKYTKKPKRPSDKPSKPGQLHIYWSVMGHGR
jgi:putative transposase